MFNHANVDAQVMVRYLQVSHVSGEKECLSK